MPSRWIVLREKHFAHGINALYCLNNAIVSSCKGDLGSVAVIVRSDGRLDEGVVVPPSSVKDAVVGVDAVIGEAEAIVE